MQSTRYSLNQGRKLHAYLKYTEITLKRTNPNYYTFLHHQRNRKKKTMDGGAPPHGRISTREHALEWLKIWSAPCVVHTCGQCLSLISTQKIVRGNSNTLEDLQLDRARRRKEWEANRWEWGVCIRKRAFMCCFACAVGMDLACFCVRQLKHDHSQNMY